MARLGEVSVKLKNVNEGVFQNICDELLIQYFKSRNIEFISYRLGTKDGTSKTTKGTPDSFFITKTGKYIYAEYTTAQSNLADKIEDDLKKCLAHAIKYEIIAIYYLCNSSNLTPEQNDKFSQICGEKGIRFYLWGLDAIAEKICYDFPMIAKEYLGIDLDTQQMMELDQFIKFCDKNKLAAPLHSQFISEKGILENIIHTYEKNNMVILSGAAGTGKTKTALETARYFQKMEYNVLCLHSNGVSLIEDFHYFTTQPGKYFLLFDDANEFDEILNILETAQNKNNSDFKFIFTVRDYNRKALLQNFKSRYQFSEIRLSSLSYDTITQFLEDTLKITRVPAMSYIYQASSGNPRMAYIIGKNMLDGKINPDSGPAVDAYQQYFTPQMETLHLAEQQDLCKTAAVLAFFKNIRISQGKVGLKDSVLDILHISLDQLQKDLNELVHLEIAVRPVSDVIQFSDQTLANYLVYFVFIKERSIDLIAFLKNVFSENQDKTAENIQMLYTSFYTEENLNYITCSLEEVAEHFQKMNKEVYQSFLVKFHYFLPDVAALYVKQQLENFTPEKGANAVFLLPTIFELLSGSEAETAIGLFARLWGAVSSFSNKEAYHKQCADWFSREFTYNPENVKLDYEKIEKAVSWVKQKYETGNCDTDSVDFYVDYLKNILALKIQQMIFVDTRSFVSNDGYLNDNKNIESIRKTAWELLTQIVHNHREYSRDVLTFLEERIRFGKKYSHKLGCFDLPYIVKLLQPVMEQFPVKSACVMGKYRKLFSESEIWAQENTAAILENAEFQLYQEIVSCYPEYDLGREQSESYHKKVLARVEKLTRDERIHDSCRINHMLTVEGCQSNIWKLKDYACVLWENYCTDETKVLDCLRVTAPFVAFYSQLALTVVHLVLEKMPVSFQNQFYNELQDEEWKYEFWKQKTQNKKQELSDIPAVIAYFQSFGKEQDTRKSIKWHDIGFLLEYEKLQPGTFKKAMDCLWDARNDNLLICQSFWESFFLKMETEKWPAEYAVTLFQKDENLLSSFYWYCVQHKPYYDDNAQILKKFLGYNQEFWIHSMAAYMENTKQDRKNSWYSITEVWKSETSVLVFDRIMDILYTEAISYGDKRQIISRMLDIPWANNEQIKNKQQWFMNFIRKHAQKDLAMLLIFSFICNEADDAFKLRAYTAYLELNPDFALFKKIDKLKTNYSWSGSEVPIINGEIHFLEQLKDALKGERYLKHRRLLSEMISNTERYKAETVVWDVMDGRRNY